MPKTKTFLNARVIQHTFANGGSVLNFSTHVDEIVAFATKHKNDAGFLNLTIGERREKSEKNGATHYVYFDEYNPKKEAAKQNDDLATAASMPALTAEDIQW